MRDLLQGFVEEDWIADLDFNTLEKVASSFVADDLREREDDVIWRLRCRDSWIYVYILIEFQLMRQENLETNGSLHSWLCPTGRGRLLPQHIGYS